MQNLNNIIDQCVDNFEKFIIYKTCITIKNIYKNIDNYYTALKLLTKPYHTLTDKEIHTVNKFNTLFQIDKLTVEKIISKPRLNGKQICITKLVLNKIKQRGNIKVFNHGTIRYKSQKNFTLYTKYIVDISVIKTYLENKDVFNTNSEFYTKKQHKLIDKFIHNYKKIKEPIPMKKTTKYDDIIEDEPIIKPIKKFKFPSKQKKSLIEIDLTNTLIDTIVNDEEDEFIDAIEIN